MEIDHTILLSLNLKDQELSRAILYLKLHRHSYKGSRKL